MANQVGKQYTCKKCGILLVVTKGGKGELKCCGQPMETNNKKEALTNDSNGKKIQM